MDIQINLPLYVGLKIKKIPLQSCNEKGSGPIGPIGSIKIFLTCGFLIFFKKIGKDTFWPNWPNSSICNFFQKICLAIFFKNSHKLLHQYRRIFFYHIQITAQFNFF